MFEAIPAGRAQLLRSVIHRSEWLEARSAFCGVPPVVRVTYL